MSATSVAEHIFVAALNKATRKNVLGHFLRRSIELLCDAAVVHGIPRDEWVSNFSAAYEAAVQHYAKRDPST